MNTKIILAGSSSLIIKRSYLTNLHAIHLVNVTNTLNETSPI